MRHCSPRSGCRGSGARPLATCGSGRQGFWSAASPLDLRGPKTPPMDRIKPPFHAQRTQAGASSCSAHASVSSREYSRLLLQREERASTLPTRCPCPSLPLPVSGFRSEATLPSSQDGACGPRSSPFQTGSRAAACGGCGGERGPRVAWPRAHSVGRGFRVPAAGRRKEDGDAVSPRPVGKLPGRNAARLLLTRGSFLLPSVGLSPPHPAAGGRGSHCLFLDTRCGPGALGRSTHHAELGQRQGQAGPPGRLTSGQPRRCPRGTCGRAVQDRPMGAPSALDVSRGRRLRGPRRASRHYRTPSRKMLSVPRDKLEPEASELPTMKERSKDSEPQGKLRTREEATCVH
ncbi:uncharacterized protein LOC118143820 isoform X3 [Callithrix jacchus]